MADAFVVLSFFKYFLLAIKVRSPSFASSMDRISLIKTLSDPEKELASAARGALVDVGVPALDALYVAMRSQSVVVRRYAIWAIGDIAEKATGETKTRAVQTVLTALTDQDGSVRWNAILALGRIRDPQTAEPLVAYFSNLTAQADGELWGNTRASITKIGIPAVDSLLGALKHQNPRARLGAAWALGDIGDLRAVGPLIIAMKDEDNVVRQNSADALGKFHDARSIPVLIQALKDSFMPVRRNAASSLGLLGAEKNSGPLFTNFNHADPTVRSEAYQAVFGLLALTSDPEKEVREAANSALAGFGLSAMVPIAMTLAVENPTTVKTATDLLGKQGVQAIPALITTLQQGNPKERVAVIKLLREFNEAQVIDALLVALNDSDPLVRQAVASALGNFKETRSVDSLLVTLQDHETPVRQIAAWALGNIKDQRAVAPLIATLKDSDTLVRQSVVSALGNIQDARAVEPLIATLKHKDTRLRPLAARALTNYKDQKSVIPLIKALKDDDSALRDSAVLALGSIRDERAIDPLIATLKDSAANVSEDALVALGKFQDPRAEKAIAERKKELAEQERKKTTCCVCGKTKASIGADIKKMQSMGVMVITHDLIAFCEKCGVAYCSNHYTWNEMAGTHICDKCGSKLQVHRSGYGEY